MSTTVPEAASAITAAAFERGLVIETAGPADEVVKLLQPLIVTDAQIEQALDIIAESTQAVVDQLGDELVSTESEEVMARSSAHTTISWAPSATSKTTTGDPGATSSPQTAWASRSTPPS